MLIDDRFSNVMFLLTLPLAIGCATGDEDDTTTGPPVVDPTTGGDDDPAATETQGGDDSTSRGDDPGTTTDEPAVSTTDEPYGSSGYIDTTGGYSCGDVMPPMVGPISAACMQYAVVATECFYYGDPACTPVSEAYCQDVIDYNAMMYGPACGMAFEEVFACLSMLTCEVLTDEMDDCTPQIDALQMACAM